MVSFIAPTLTTATIITLLASQTSGWLVGIYSTQNSCGGDWAPDTERGGPAKTSSNCNGHGIIEVKAINISDWDTGCKVAAYDSWSCTDPPLREFIKEDEDVVNDNWSCINQLAEDPKMANFQALKYICE